MTRADVLGQTIGQALEPYADSRFHGHSLSAGKVVELYIATKLHGLRHDILLQTLYEAKENFPLLEVRCEDYDEVLQSLHSLQSDEVTLCLPAEDGTFSKAERIPDSLILEGIDFYRESYGE